MRLKLLVQLNFGVSQYPIQLAYTTLRDSKAYSAVVDSKPCGDVEISKRDCSRAEMLRYCTSETIEDLGQKEATEWENDWWSRPSYK